MFGEGGRYSPAKDSADFIPGLIGAYPNYFIDVRQQELPELFALLASFTKGPKDVERLAKFGVNRADDSFWTSTIGSSSAPRMTSPSRAGSSTLNRYDPRAR